MKRNLFLLLYIYFSFLGYSQNIRIAGQVSDEEKTPLPFVNVSVQDSYIGTTTNKDGGFSMIVPDPLHSNNIIITHLGYKTDTIKLDPSLSFYNIELQPLNYQIVEVIVFPDDSIVRTLKEAIRRIPENYLHTNSRQTGFYREYLQNQGEYLYFGEAIFDVFQPSYKNTEQGSIKILKTRINKQNISDSVSISGYFYGGHLLPLRKDLVKNRDLFLNPHEMKSFIFHIDSVIAGEGKIFWKIGITPAFKSNSKYKGSLLLDSKSLTINEITYEYTQAGSDARSRSLFPILKSLSRQIILKYSGGPGQRYLKYMSDKEYLQKRKTNQKYIMLNEYVATNVDTINNSPIPYNEQNQAGTIFATFANDYKHTDWKDYTVLDKDSVMKKINLLEISGGDSEEILSKRYKLNTKGKAKKALSNFAVRSFFDVSIGMKQISSTIPVQLNYVPDSDHHFQLNFQGISNEPLYMFGMMLGYRFTNKLGLFYESEAQVNSFHYLTSGLGIRYDLPLKNYGRKWLVAPSFKMEFEEYGLASITKNNYSKFSAEGKKYSSDKLSFSVGQSAINTCLGFEIRKNISRQLSIKLSTEYTIPLISNPTLFIAEKSGFLLTRKHGELEINTGNQFTFEGQNMEMIKHISLERFEIKLGLEFGR